MKARSQASKSIRGDKSWIMNPPPAREVGRPKLLSDEDCQDAVKALEQGWTLEQLAKEVFRCHVNTVRRSVQRHRQRNAESAK